MRFSSNGLTSQATDAQGTTNPRSVESLIPVSERALIAAIHKALPIPPPPVFESMGLVPDDGSSHSSDSPLCTTPCSQERPPSFPNVPFSASPNMSRRFPTLPARRPLVEAPCAGKKPIKQARGYRCPTCERVFKRRDDAKRHIDSAGMRVECRYCGRRSSRRDGHKRHLKTKACKRKWEVGRKAGRFTERTMEDAFYN